MIELPSRDELRGLAERTGMVKAKGKSKPKPASMPSEAEQKRAVEKANARAGTPPTRKSDADIIRGALTDFSRAVVGLPISAAKVGIAAAERLGLPGLPGSAALVRQVTAPIMPAVKSGIAATEKGIEHYLPPSGDPTQRFSEFGGGLAGFIGLPGAGTVWNALEEGAGPIAALLPRALQPMAKAGLAGAVFGGGEETGRQVFEQGRITQPGQVAQAAGMGAALPMIPHALLGGVAAVRRAKMPAPAPIPPFPGQLALPAPRGPAGVPIPLESEGARLRAEQIAASQAKVNEPPNIMRRRAKAAAAEETAAAKKRMPPLPMKAPPEAMPPEPAPVAPSVPVAPAESIPAPVARPEAPAKAEAVTPLETRPKFVVDAQGAIARVTGWESDGAPIVAYPGKAGGIRPGTAQQGGGAPYEYRLTGKWRPTTADDFDMTIKPSKSERMMVLRMWRDEFGQQRRAAAAPQRNAKAAAANKAGRREIIETRLRMGKDVRQQDLDEFPDLAERYNRIGQPAPAPPAEAVVPPEALPAAPEVMPALEKARRRAQRAPKEERPIWADELESAGGRIDPDGTVLLYHGTTAEAAARIRKEGVLRRPADADDSYGVYLSSSPDIARSYGDGTVVAVRVKASDLNLDDVFPGERADFSVPTKGGTYKPQSVEATPEFAPPLASLREPLPIPTEAAMRKRLGAQPEGKSVPAPAPAETAKAEGVEVAGHVASAETEPIGRPASPAPAEVAAAKERLRRKWTTARAVAPEISKEDFVDLVVIGRHHLKRTGRDFTAWSKAMAESAGEGWNPHLAAVWAQVNQQGPQAATAAPVAPPTPPTPPTAKAVAPQPSPAERAKYAGNLNLERIDTPADVRNFIVRRADEMADELWARKRGVRTWEETRTAAAQVGVEVRKNSVYLDGRKVGPATTTNAERTFRLRELELAADGKAREAEKTYRDAPTADNRLALLAALREQQLVSLSRTGNAAEIGRALNIHKMIARARAIENLSEREAFTKRVLDALGGRELNDQILDLMQQIPEGDIAGRLRFIRNLHQFTTSDKLFAYWIRNVLSGVATHAVNTINNVLNIAGAVPYRALRGAVETPVARWRGREKVFYAAESTAALQGLVKGIPEAIVRGIRTFTLGLKPEEAMKLEVAPFYELPGDMKNPLNLVTRGLGAADEVSKEINRAAELAGVARRTALREGLRGEGMYKREGQLLANPTQEMLEAAEAAAGYGTYTGPPELLQRALTQVRRNAPGAEYIVPFLQVPYKITDMAFEMSPRSFLEVVNPATKGTPKETEAITKGLIGSMVLTGATTLAMQDRVTGPVPRDAGERDEFYRLGKQPFSVKAGDKWYSYRVLGPFVLHFAAAAAFHEAMTKERKQPTEDRIMRVVMAAPSAVLNASYLSGLATFMETIADPERGSPARGIASTITGFIPGSSMLRSTAAATDPYIREANTIYERIRAGLPIVSRGLRPKLDVLGRPSPRRGSGSLGAFSPIQVSQETKDVVDREMARLKVRPGPVGKSLTIENKEVLLSPPQRWRYQKAVGQAMYQAAKATLGDGQYHQATDEQKEKWLGDAMDAARREATDRFKWELSNKGQGR